MTFLGWELVVNQRVKLLNSTLFCFILLCHSSLNISLFVSHSSLLLSSFHWFRIISMSQIAPFLIILSSSIASLSFVQSYAISLLQDIIRLSILLYFLFVLFDFLSLLQIRFLALLGSILFQKWKLEGNGFPEFVQLRIWKNCIYKISNILTIRESVRRIRSVFCILQSVFREKKNEIVHGNRWIAVENIGEGRSEVCNSWKANKQWIASFDVTKCYDSINLVLCFISIEIRTFFWMSWILL